MSEYERHGRGDGEEVHAVAAVGAGIEGAEGHISMEKFATGADAGDTTVFLRGRLGCRRRTQQERKMQVAYQYVMEYLIRELDRCPK